MFIQAFGDGEAKGGVTQVRCDLRRNSGMRHGWQAKEDDMAFRYQRFKVQRGAGGWAALPDTRRMVREQMFHRLTHLAMAEDQYSGFFIRHFQRTPWAGYTKITRDMTG